MANPYTGGTDAADQPSNCGLLGTLLWAVWHERIAVMWATT